MTARSNIVDTGTTVGAPSVGTDVNYRMLYRYTEGGKTYRLPRRPQLTAVIERTEEGFVATAPQLDSLGYGGDPFSAITDLIDATREYLAVLAEDDIPLSPRTAPHAAYVSLLAVPGSSWFAAITGERGQDAS